MPPWLQRRFEKTPLKLRLWWLYAFHCFAWIWLNSLCAGQLNVLPSNTVIHMSWHCDTYSYQDVVFAYKRDLHSTAHVIPLSRLGVHVGTFLVGVARLSRSLAAIWQCQPSTWLAELIVTIRVVSIHPKSLTIRKNDWNIKRLNMLPDLL